MTANAAIRNALLETLSCLLSSDTVARAAAEQRIKAFEVTDDYGSHLTDIVLTPAIDWQMRQLSAVLLKQYIICHWTSQYDKFEEPEVNQENKVRIRAALISSLGQECDLSDSRPEKRLKSAIAYAVYAIGHYDWPEEWPDLLNILIAYVTSGNRSAVYASMKVFVEMCHEITESQMPSIAPLLMPQMLQIIRDSENFSLRTRGRAVQVFTFIAETLAILSELDRNAGNKFLTPVLADFLQTLVQILQLNDSLTNEVDTGLRKDVFSCLTILLKNFPKKLSKWMPQILATVWHSLTSCAVVYVNTIVNSDSDSSQHDAAVDSDGEVLGQESLIFSLFEFVSVLTESSRTRKMVKQGMSDLIYYILMYIQITDEQVQVWSINPDQFVEDEDDDSFSFSVRLAAQDVLMSLATEFEEGEDKESNEAFQAAFIDAIKRHFTESNHIRNSQAANNNNSHNNWWKIQESCLFALGSLSESFVEVIQANGPLADHVRDILHTVLVTDFLSGSVFFAGRCIWTAARFTPIMTPEIVDQFLQITVTSFSNPSPIIKISATRATYSFCSHLSDSGQQSLMLPYLSAILDGLLSIGIQYSSEVLALVLETLCLVATVDSDFTAANENKIAPLAIATFIRNSSDPVLISCCQNIFKELCKNSKCTASLQSRLGPTINSILSPAEVSDTATTLQPAALDILTSMARSSPLPLSDILMQLFCSAVNCILRTSDDNSCLQNGGECIRAFVSRATEQVMSVRFDAERNGAQMVMHVCMHLLDPRVGESCSAFVGRLVSISIGKAAAILGPDNVHLLLRSVLSKLQTAETLSVIQSLIMVFAHLIHYEMQTVLDFLSSIPGPTGSQSALEFLLTLWLSRQHLFFGSYEKKVSILALGKLLQHSVLSSSGDSTFNLNTILVPGDPIHDEGIQTRSKTKCVEKWTQVPCSVKILKCLLAEVQNLEEQRETCSQDDDDEDNDEDDSIDDGETSSPNSKHSAANCSGGHDEDWDDEDDFDEEDADADEDELVEIKEMNLTSYLSDFIRSFKQTSFYSEFLSQLNASEQKLMQDIV